MSRTAFALLLTGLCSLALAAPEGGNVVAGQAAISKPDALTTSILQSSQSAIINWKGFSIDVNELVKFLQPNAGAVALNRVTGIDPSTILGELLANGRVFLVNPNGILFGPHSKVDVGSLLATTFDLKDSDFLAGKYEFLQKPGAKPAFVVNQGQIKVAKNGAVFLVAPGVKNEGLIIAQLGTVALGSGGEFKVRLRDDGPITYCVAGKVLESVVGPDGKPLSASVGNTGTITNPGGTVALTGDAARGVVTSVVNQEGVLEAKSFRIQGGKVIMTGRDEGIVQNKGLIDVSAAEAGAALGEVSLTGEKVGNFDTILAKGAEGADGGKVSLRSTGQTLLTPDSVIDVSGGADSSGGSVDLWSDTNATVAGTLAARGGARGGDGGFIEVSSGGGMALTAAVDTSAPAGETGTLLLDPKTVTVAAGGGAGLANVDAFNDNPTEDATIDPATINAAVANVTIQANTDIKVNSAVNMATPGVDLALQAGRTVEINADTKTNNGPISLTANDPGADPANRDPGAGEIKMAAGTTIDAGSGTVTLTLTVAPGADGTAGGLTVDNVKSTGTVTLSSVGAIVEADAGDAETDVTANTLNFTVTGADALIGADGNPLEIDAGTLNAQTANGNVVLADTAGGVALGTVNAGTGLVILDAAGGAITDGAAGAGPSNVTAGAVNLTTSGATGGAIGTAALPIRTTIGILTATTNDGGVFVSESDGLLINSVTAKEAGNTPYVGAGGSVVVDSGNPHAGTHDVTITAGGDVVLDTVIAPDVATITATSGSLLDNNQELNNVTARTVVLQAAAAIGQDPDPIETSVEALNANTTNGSIYLAESDGGKVTNIAAGGAGNGVVLTSSTGAFRLGTVSALGKVTIKADGGALLDDNGATLNLTAQTAELTARDGVGTSGDPLETTVAELSATVSGDGAPVMINETDGLSSLAVKTKKGDVTLNFSGGPLTFVASTGHLSAPSAAGTALTFETTGSDIVLDTVNAGSASAVTLTAAGVLSDGNGGALNLTAGTTTLSAGSGIGTSADPLETAIDTLTAKAKTGGVFVTETDALTLGTVTATGSGSDVAITNAGGDLRLGSVSARNQVTLSAGGSLLDDNGAALNISASRAAVAAGGSVGTAGDALETSLTTLVSATAAAGGVFVANSTALTVTAAQATGGDLSLTALGNLAVGQTTAVGRTVTLTASGALTDANGATVNVTAATANLSAASIGTLADPLDTAVGTLTASTSAGGLYLRQTGGLTLTSATALGSGADIDLAVAEGDLVLGTATAQGDDVFLSASGAITDGNGGTVNVTSHTLTISAPSGIGTAADSLELSVDQLSATGGAGGVAAVNAGPLALTDASLEGKGSAALVFDAESITILDVADNLALLDLNGSVTMRTAAGDIVFLDQNDTIQTQGTGTITIQAGTTAGSGAVAVVGNLTTAGGNIKVTADRTITIGKLDAGAGDVVVAAASGLILDGNGPLVNLIGGTVTLSGNTPSERDAELETMTKIAEAAAAVEGASAKEASASSFTAGAAVTAAAQVTAQGAVNVAEADEAAKSADKDAKDKVSNDYFIAMSVLQGVSLALDITNTIVGTIAAVAQAVPFTGDGGSATAAFVVQIAKNVVDATVFGVSIAQNFADGEAADAASALAQSEAQLYAAKGDLALATSTAQAFQEGASIATAAYQAAVIHRDAAAVMRDQAIAAEDAANVIGTAAQPLGIQAQRLDITAGDSSVYLDGPGVLGLGDITPTAGAHNPAPEIIVTVPGDLAVRGTITSPTWVRLESTAGAILDGDGKIVAPDLLAKAATGIGAPDAVQTDVDRLAATGGAGGVAITNEGALQVTTVGGVSGVTAGGTLSLTSTGSLTLSQPVSAPGQTVNLTSTTGALIDDNGATTNVTGATLNANAATGIDLDTDVATLTATNTTSGDILIDEVSAISLNGVQTQGGNGNVNVKANGSVSVDAALSAHGSGKVDLTAANNSAITVNAGVSSTSGKISLLGDDGIGLNATVSTTGDVTLSADVDADLIGVTNINVANAVNGAAVDINGGVTLAQSTTLTGTTSVDFEKTIVGGANSLTVNSPATLFHGNVTGLGVLSTNAAGTTTIDAATVSGAVLDFNDDVVASKDTVLTGTTSIDFAKTLNSDGTPRDVTLNSPTTMFHGIVGGVSPLDVLSTDAAGTTTIDTTAVTGAELDFNDAVVVSQDTTLTGTTSIDFAKTLNSDGTPRDVTLNSPTTMFHGIVGGTSLLDVLTTDADGTTTIDTTAVSGAVLDFNDDVVASQDTTLTGTTSTDFAKTLNSDATARDVTLNSPTTMFHGIVGGTSPLEVLTTDAAGTTTVDTTAVTGAVLDFNDDVVTTVASTLTGTTLIDFAAGKSLTIGDAATEALTVVGATANFNGTVDSGATFANNLTVNATNALFGDQVGHQANGALGTLWTDAAGTTTLSTDVVTADTLNFDDDVVTTVASTLTGTTLVDFAAGKSLTIGDAATEALTVVGATADFNGTVDSGATFANNLTVNAPTTMFHAVVGGVSPLGVLATDAAGTTTIDTTAVTGAVLDFNDKLVLDQTTTLTGTTSVDFAQTVDSAASEQNSLTVNSPQTTFNGNVGTAAAGALGSLTTDAAGTTALNATQFTTAGNTMTLNDAVVLSQDVTLTDTGTTGITFNSTVDSDATARDLTLNAGAGDVTFNGVVGAASALDELTVNSAHDVTVNATVTVAGVTQATGTGTTTVNADVTTTGATGIALSSATIAQNANLTSAGANPVRVTATTGSLTMAASANTTAGTGTVTYTAQSNAAIAALNTGGNVNVTATTGAIIDANGAAVNVSAANLVAGAATGVDLDTAVTNLTASVTGAGNITVNETDGANVLNVSAANGSATVTSATGNLNVTTTSATGTVTLTATAGALTDANGAANNVTANTLTASSATGVDLDTTVVNASATVSGTGGVNLNEADGATFTNVATVNGAIDLVSGGTLKAVNVVADGAGRNVTITTTAGDLIVDLVKATQGAITLTAAGRILENPDPEADIVGNSLTLTAGSGIGTPAEAVEIQTPTLDAATNAGGIHLGATTATTLNQVSAGAGDIVITNTGGDMVVNTVTAAGGGLSLTSVGSILGGSAASQFTANGPSSLTAGGLIGVSSTAALNHPLNVNTNGNALTVAAGGAPVDQVSIAITGDPAMKALISVDSNSLGVATLNGEAPTLDAYDYAGLDSSFTLLSPQAVFGASGPALRNLLAALGGILTAQDFLERAVVGDRR